MIDDEPYDNEEFADCPAGKPVDEFHQRIVMGLTATLDGLEQRREGIASIPFDERDDDQRTFLALYETVVDLLGRVTDPSLPYDRRFALATKAQTLLSEMDLLVD